MNPKYQEVIHSISFHGASQIVLDDTKSTETSFACTTGHWNSACDCTKFAHLWQSITYVPCNLRHRFIRVGASVFLLFDLFTARSIILRQFLISTIKSLESHSYNSPNERIVSSSKKLLEEGVNAVILFMMTMFFPSLNLRSSSCIMWSIIFMICSDNSFSVFTAEGASICSKNCCKCSGSFLDRFLDSRTGVDLGNNSLSERDSHWLHRSSHTSSSKDYLS